LHFFLYHHTSITYIYSLSLHDALPILSSKIMPTHLFRKHLYFFHFIAIFHIFHMFYTFRHLAEYGMNAIEMKGIEHVKNMKNGEDRKSTRLNSSHVSISYTVFCLKKTK